MKVLHLISSGGMYGAEAVILNLSRELNDGQENASRLGVFAHHGQPFPALHEAALQRNVESVLLPCKGQLDLSVLERIRTAVFSGGVDLVHAHGYKADIYAFLALRGKHRPALVSTCHTWYDNDLAVRCYGAADRWVLRSFDQVVAVSDEVRARLLKAGVAKNRVHVIRNGIDVGPFSASGVAQARHKRSREQLRVGLVGRLAPEKGVDLFVRAAARVAGEFPHVCFVVAGEGPDRAVLDQLVDQLHLRGRVELVGALTDMPAFYASLDVLVSSSRQEGLPMALLEGMASGLPLVATRAGAVPEIVVDGQTGLLVDTGDEVQLADAIVRVLDDAELRTAFGASGRRRVLEEFSARRMAADYSYVYAEALSRRAFSGPTSRKSSV